MGATGYPFFHGSGTFFLQKSMDDQVNEINDKLATACMKTCASCCKKGLLFMPSEEYEGIITWLKKHSPEEMQTFQSRAQAFDGFYLYDQGDACQFLDANNLCRLHQDQVKPSECYWWPMHVYCNEESELELRVSDSCCEAYQHITPDSSLVSDIEKSIQKWGPELIQKFRKEYQGSYHNRFIKKYE